MVCTQQFFNYKFSHQGNDPHDYLSARQIFVDILQNYQPWERIFLKQKQRFLNSHRQAIKSSAIASSLFILRSVGLFLLPLALIITFQLNWASNFLLTLLSGVSYCAIASVLHDASHGALFENPHVNIWIGRLTAIFLPVDFAEFKSSHCQHHRFNQHLQDPKNAIGTKSLRELLESKCYREAKQQFTNTDNFIVNSNPWILELMLQVPFLYYATFPLLFLFGPIYIIGYGGDFSPLQSGKLRPAIMLLMKAVAWTSLAYGFGILIWYLLSIWIGLFCMSFVFLTHINPYSITPVGKGNPTSLMSFNICNISFGSLIDCLTGNFSGYHIEHHIFPSIPAYRLHIVSSLVSSAPYNKLYKKVKLFSFSDVNWFLPEVLRCTCLAGKEGYYIVDIGEASYKFNGPRGSLIQASAV